MSTIPDIDAIPQIMGEDGQFHAMDEEANLSDTPIEAWIALLFFFALGLTVFLPVFYPLCAQQFSGMDRRDCSLFIDCYCIYRRSDWRRKK